MFYLLIYLFIINIKDTFVTNYLFDGAQANIVKELSANFHVQHQFSLGSQVMPPMYNFMSGYMTEKVNNKLLYFP